MMAEAIVNPTMPPTNTRRRPNRSPTATANSRNNAKASE